MKNIPFLLFILMLTTMAISCKKNEPIVEPEPVPVTCDPNKVCLLTPLNHSIGISQTVGFTWKKFADINEYEFQLSPFADFPTDNNIVQSYCDYEIVNDTICTPQRYNGGISYYLLSNTVYYWRVRGINAVGDTTAWSNVHDFTVLDLRDSLAGDYNVAEISWDIDYPFPYDEYITGNNYVARVTKNGATGIHVEIIGKGLSWNMRMVNDLMYAEDVNDVYYASVTFYRGVVGPDFIPGSEIRVTDRNRGNNPPYHIGGEKYEGERR